MKRIFDVALGILAAIGGFVDIGDTVSAGASCSNSSPGSRTAFCSSSR